MDEVEEGEAAREAIHVLLNRKLVIHMNLRITHLISRQRLEQASEFHRLPRGVLSIARMESVSM